MALNQPPDYRDASTKITTSLLADMDARQLHENIAHRIAAFGFGDAELVPILAVL